VVELYKERASTLNELADAVEYFYQQIHPTQELLEKHLTEDVKPVLRALTEKLAASDWSQQALHDLIQQAVTDSGLKFPKVAMPLRVMVVGIAQTPSVDAVLALLGKEETLGRIGKYL
jgi:glutamyl-tRNA synthetase